MSTKSLFRIIESVGVLTLMMVLLGTRAVIKNPAAINQIDSLSGAWVSIFLTLIGCAIPIALLHITGILKNKLFRTIFGWILIICGSIVMIALPAYLDTMLSLSVEFWYKVSIFSLPAICIDGGLFTLFSELEDSEGTLSKRESTLLGFGFSVYTISAVTINFIVLLGGWTVNHQIVFYRMLILFTVGLFAAIMYRKSRKKS